MKLFPVSKNVGSEFEEASTQCDGNLRSVLIVGVGISKYNVRNCDLYTHSI